MKYRYDITGMSCAACVAHVERAAQEVLKKKSIKAQVTVSLLTSSMSVETEQNVERESMDRALIDEISHAGYGASPADEKGMDTAQITADKSKKEKEQLKKSWLNFTASAVLTLLLMVFSMGPMFGLHLITQPIVSALVQLAFTLPVLIINRKYFIGGWKALIHLSPNMDSLIAIGSGASVIYGLFILGQMIYYFSLSETAMVSGLSHQLYFESAAMIVTLVSLGKNMEKGARVRASSAIQRLASLLPETALLIRDGQEQEVPVSTLNKGDMIRCREGALIPVDGMVVEGAGSVNEAALTGESIPADKKAGDDVHAACTLVEGSITVRAEQVGEGTTLSHILRLLEDAAASRAPVARLADRISLYFVPAVLAISLLTFAVWMVIGRDLTVALSFAISIMVISCPCALGLATPTAILVATGRGAEHGILFKSAETLEKLHAVEVVALDKTGTMTEGLPEVTDAVILENQDEQTLLSFAAAVERHSTHPLSTAITYYAQQKNLPMPETREYASVIGEGVCAKINDNICMVGKPILLEKNGVCSLEINRARAEADRMEKQGKTVVFVGLDDHVIGLIALADRMRKDTPSAIQRLADMGVKSVMLTGDNETVAAAIAARAGVESYRASLLPGDKEKEIRIMAEQGSVAMVGDGINDAPALSRADVGIAIGAGTDVAIDCADIVLTQNNLTGVADAVSLSRHTMRVIAQNLFWALLYNSICIPIAAGVLAGVGIVLNPMIASAAMSLSSVCVVLNSLRLRRVRLESAPRQVIHPKKIPNKQKNQALEEKSMQNQTVVLSIKGMMCAHCVAHVKKALESVEGVREVTVSLDEANATVVGSADREEMVSAVRAAGYECE